MQDRHLTEILSKQLGIKHSQDEADIFSSSYFEGEAISVASQTANLPAGARTPTAKELQDMQQYAKDYRMSKPKASAREVKRAVQRKFSVQILPNT